MGGSEDAVAGRFLLVGRCVVIETFAIQGGNFVGYGSVREETDVDAKMEECGRSRAGTPEAFFAGETIEKSVV
jgi:hypothetical protein